MAKHIAEDVFFSSIVDVNAALQKKEFSCEELTRAFCDRLEKSGPRYNALALSLRHTALRSAKDVDGDLKRGRLRGPLQGVPFGAKDLLSVANTVTTWGAPPYAAQKFEETASCLSRLEKTGGILTGKLAMISLAGAGGYRSAAASLFGPGLNPWNPRHWAGGSSSGSAAAVAAGLVTYAIGSETWGSILTPSSFCGVTGLRPTYGLVSRHGSMALSWTMDKIGPICRTADDCGHVLQAMAGSDALDPAAAGRSFYYTPQYAPPLAELRAGFAPGDFGEHADAGSRKALQEALNVFKAMGMPIAEVALPPGFPYGAVASTIIGAEGSAVFEPLVQSGQADALPDKVQIAGLKAGLEIPAKDYLRAMRIRRLMSDKVRDAFAEIDILIAPTTHSSVPLISAPLDSLRRSRLSDAPVEGLRDLSAAGNLMGWPAITLPIGLSEDGLPAGICLASHPFTENKLLFVAREFQKRTDFHKLTPKAT